MEEFFPTAEDLVQVEPLVLDHSLPMRERWLSLRDPADVIAADIATEGLKLYFHQDPPMSYRDSPPVSVITKEEKFPILKPFVKDWEQGNSL